MRWIIGGVVFIAFGLIRVPLAHGNPPAPAAAPAAAKDCDATCKCDAQEDDCDATCTCDPAKKPCCTCKLLPVKKSSGWVAARVGLVEASDPASTTRSIGASFGYSRRFGLGASATVLYVKPFPSVPALGDRTELNGVQVSAGPQLFAGSRKGRIRLRVGVELGAILNSKVVVPFIKPEAGLRLNVCRAWFFDLGAGAMGLSKLAVDFTTGVEL